MTVGRKERQLVKNLFKGDASSEDANGTGASKEKRKKKPIFDDGPRQMLIKKRVPRKHKPMVKDWRFLYV